MRMKKGDVKRTRLIFALFLVAGTALALMWPAASGATEPNNQSNTYMFFMEEPNVAQDAAGNTLAVTGDGSFSVHPKSASGGGSFTFTPADGQPFSGSWTVNGLVAFQPYGCGVVFGTPIDPDLCGGRLALSITAITPFGPRPALLTIFCVIGVPVPSIEEGINAAIPGVGDFNRQTAGMNVYVLQP
jgi:hypothetical protein